MALALSVQLGATITLAAPAVADRPEPKPRIVLYAVGTDGKTTADYNFFRAVVRATLNDPRGWSLGGRVVFRESSRGLFRVTLATPATVGSYGGCDSYFSCRSSSMVLINEARWKNATPSYRGSKLLHSYRQHVINHEVGHALGFGHASCSGVGRPAPVMQQQSKGLGGCSRSVRPLAAERFAYSRRQGVEAIRPPPRLILGRSAGGVKLGDTRSAVLAILGEPEQPETQETIPGSVDGFAYPRLSVRYANGRVASVTTRSPDDRSISGLAVDMRKVELLRRLPGLQCGASAAGLAECTTDTRTRISPKPHKNHENSRAGTTSFVIRAGRVLAVRIDW